MKRNQQYEAALNLIFDSNAGDSLSIRDYLYTLLVTLWNENEAFSGKQPFGDSGWEYDLYLPLIKAGYIHGVIDEYGCIELVDSENGHNFVSNLIRYMIYMSNKMGE